MLEPAFDYLPTLDLLDYLTPGVLGQKGNLLKAVRLWVMLRSLYSDLAVEFQNEDAEWFSNAQWRDIFLQPTNRTKPLQQAPLLLRFERYFYGNYIANTERAKLFTEMGFEQAEKRFQAEPEVSAQGLSLVRWFGDRPWHKGSVFCLAQYRSGDNNVVMRLRAWGPNVEVLLPLQRLLIE